MEKYIPKEYEGFILICGDRATNAMFKRDRETGIVELHVASILALSNLRGCQIQCVSNEIFTHKIYYTAGCIHAYNLNVNLLLDLVSGEAKPTMAEQPDPIKELNKAKILTVLQNIENNICGIRSVNSFYVDRYVNATLRDIRYIRDIIKGE